MAKRKGVASKILNIQNIGWNKFITTNTIDPRHDAVLWFYNNHLYIFGGYNAENIFNDLWQYNLANNSFGKIIIHNAPILVRTVSWFDGKYVYIFGGWNDKEGFLNQLWQYDVVEQIFLEISPKNGAKPFARSGAVAWYDGTYAYMFSGGSLDGCRLNDLWRYDANQNIWQQITTDDAPLSRYKAVAWYDGTYAYIFGGVNGSNVFNDLWRYDGVKWEQINILFQKPPARYGAVAWYDGRYAYVFGGINGSNVFNDLWRYDAIQNTWIIVFSINNPDARFLLSAIFSNKYAYVFGGGNYNFYFNDLWQYIAAPIVNLIQPIPNAVNVDPNIQIKIAFSEAIDVGTLNHANITLHEGSASGPTVALGAINDDGNNYYSFSSTTELKGIIQYFLVIENVANLNGLVIEKSIFNFTTAAEKPMPTVNLIHPQDNNLNVLENVKIEIAFSEAVIGVDATNITLHEGSETGPTVTLSTITAEINNHYSFSSISLLKNTTLYYLIIEGIIAVDKSRPVARTVFNFTTRKLGHWITFPDSANAPTPRSHMVSWYDGNYAYVYGGLNDVKNILNELWTFDSVANSWLKIDVETPQLGATAKIASAVAWYDGTYAYIFGGENENYLLTNDLYQYIFVTKTLAKITPVGAIPPARANSVAWYDGKYAYIFGGLDSGQNILGDLWKYDATQNIWEEKITIITPPVRQNAGVWYDGQYAYVFGGTGDKILNDLWRYDASQNTWKEVGLSINQPPARQNMSCWYDGVYGHVFGGESISIYNDLWSYNALNDSWELVNTLTIIQPRHSSTVWVENKQNGYIFGGILSDGTNINKVIAYSIDLLPIKISLINPQNGDKNIFTNVQIKIAFSEAVRNVTSTNISLHEGSEAGPAVTLGAITAESDNHYSFSSDTELKYNTQYYLIIENIYSVIGNIPVAKTVFNFTTKESVTISLINPKNAENNVETNVKIEIAFSEAVDVGTLTHANISLHEGSETGPTVALGAIIDKGNNHYSFSSTASLKNSIKYFLVIENVVTIFYETISKTVFNFTTKALPHWIKFDPANVPPARTLSTSWYDNNYAYVYGGYSTTDWFNDLWVYDEVKQSFIEITLDNAPKLRGMTSWNDGQYAYMFGGSNPDGDANNVVRKYDPITETLTELPSDPDVFPRTGAVSWYDGTHAYIFGGVSRTDTWNSLWQYNSTQNTWLLINPPSYPSARAFAVAWYDGTYAYVFGGVDHGVYFNDLWKFDNINWIQIGISGIKPSTRAYAVSWFDNGYLYLFGGDTVQEGNIQSLNDLWRYDVLNDIWEDMTTTVTNIPSGRFGMSIWKSSDKSIYIFGGAELPTTRLNELWAFTDQNITPIPAPKVSLINPTNGASDVDFLLKMEIEFSEAVTSVDPTHIRLCEGSETGPTITLGAITAESNNKYSFSTSKALTYTTKYYLIIEDVYTVSGKFITTTIFNFETKLPQWNVINTKNDPEPRRLSVSFCDGMKAYIYGGYNRAGTILNDLWLYDLVSQEYTEITLNNTPEIGQAVSWYDGKYWYIFGGRDNNGALNTLWKYDPITFQLTLVNTTNPPPARGLAVSWYDGQYAYVFGGFGTAPWLDDLWRFNSTDNSWLQINTTNKPPARNSSISWFDGTNAYMFSGATATGIVNDLWKFNGTDWIQVTLPVTNTVPARTLSKVWYDGEYAYIFGGNEVNDIIGSDVWRYDAIQNSWLLINTKNQISGRHSGTLFIDRDKNAYVFGGRDRTTYFNDLYKLITHVETPTVSLINPKNNSNNVETNVKMEIAFNKAVDVSTLTHANISLHEWSSASPTTATLDVIIDEGNNHYSFSSVDKLNPQTHYFLVIEGVVDFQGISVERSVFNFRTK